MRDGRPAIVRSGSGGSRGRGPLRPGSAGCRCQRRLQSLPGRHRNDTHLCRGRCPESGIPPSTLGLLRGRRQCYPEIMWTNVVISPAHIPFVTPRSGTGVSTRCIGVGTKVARQSLVKPKAGIGFTTPVAGCNPGSLPGVVLAGKSVTSFGAASPCVRAN